MNNIVLIGFSQSGKTTIGKLLAEKTQQSFIELEEELEKVHQKSIDELINEAGKEQFRSLEIEAIEKMMSRKNKVIAVRSDSICDEEIANTLVKIGTVVYLHTDKNELCRRKEKGCAVCEQTGEAHFDEGKFSADFSKREPLFFGIAGIIIQTAGKTPEEIVDEILLLI